MKIAINKNETELEKMKRESLEWIERHGKTAPPFISVAVNAFCSESTREKVPNLSMATDELQSKHFPPCL
jgi:hypothetical protein